MDKFITFGTKSLNLELFKKVLPYPSNSITKPIGGLWLTKYIGINANEWLTYLECNRSLFYSKFNRNACIINLKEDANILYINNLTDFNNIYEKYPSLLTDNKILDFQKIAKDYDGLYIDKSIIYDIGYDDWSISSLVLFNLECIKSYTPIEIDYLVNEYAIEFDIAKIEDSKNIEKTNQEFNYLYKLLKYELEFIVTKEQFEGLNIKEYYNKLYKIIRDLVLKATKDQNIVNKILENSSLEYGQKGKLDIIDVLIHNLFEEEFEKYRPKDLYYGRKLTKK